VDVLGDQHVNLGSRFESRAGGFLLA